MCKQQLYQLFVPFSNTPYSLYGFLPLWSGCPDRVTVRHLIMSPKLTRQVPNGTPAGCETATVAKEDTQRNFRRYQVSKKSSGPNNHTRIFISPFVVVVPLYNLSIYTHTTDRSITPLNRI